MKLFLIYFSVLLCSFAAQAQQSEESLRSKLKSLQVSGDEDRIRHSLLMEYSGEVVISAILEELNQQSLGPEARNRLWRMLALVPGNQGSSAITHADRIAALLSGFQDGAVQTKICIAARVPQIEPPSSRTAFVQAAADLLPETAEPAAVLSYLTLFMQTGQVPNEVEAYVEGLASNLTNSVPQLAANLNMHPAAVSLPNTMESGLMRTALAARIASKGVINFAEAIAYVENLPEEQQFACDAMSLIPLSNFLNDAQESEKIDWLHEYTRRYSMTSAAVHRSRRGVRYLILLHRQYPELAGEICDEIGPLNTNFLDEPSVVDGIQYMQTYLCF